MTREQIKTNRIVEYTDMPNLLLKLQTELDEFATHSSYTRCDGVPIMGHVASQDYQQMRKCSKLWNTFCLIETLSVRWGSNPSSRTTFDHIYA
jgi:hypothetical protein